MDTAKLYLIESNVATNFENDHINNELSEGQMRLSLDKSQADQQRINLLQAKIENINQEIEKLNAEKEVYLHELSLISNDSTIQKLRNQSILIQRISVEKQSTQIMDVIKELKKGTQLLKYGKYGSPRYHQFEISLDNIYLRWYSRKKKNNFLKTSIKLESITHLQKGHLYKQELADAKYHELAFSISYKDTIKNEAKTLEVIARNKTDFQIWTKGLEFIIKSIKTTKKEIAENVRNDDQQEMKYDADIHFPSESFMEIHKRDQNAFERSLAKREDPTKEAIDTDFKLLRTKFENVAKFCEKVVESRNSENYGIIDSVVMVQRRLEELFEATQKIEEHLIVGDKKLSILIYQMHDIMVELKALDEKLFVLN